MFTLMIGFGVFLAVIFVVLLLAWLIALAPLVSIIILMPLIDILMFKVVFHKKKKRERKEE